jgi:hypothetical protein
MRIVPQIAPNSYSSLSSPVLMLPAPPVRLALPAPRIAGLLAAPKPQLFFEDHDPLYDTDLPEGWQTYQEAVAELDPLMQRIRANLARLGYHDLIEEYLS